MAINLNLPSMMGTPYTTEADKLISDIRSFQAPDIPTPPPTIPKLTGFGDRLARIGGFGDDPGELKTKEELEKMTQAEIDAYVRQRKQARRLGTSEALIRFGEALQGKPAAQNALAREQARRNLELQSQYQKEYENAIRMAEQTNPQQARLLRSLGLPGYINVQQKRAEEYFLGSDKPGSVERFSVFSNKAGRVIGSVLKTDAEGIAAVQADPDKQIVPLSTPSTSRSAVSDPLRTITKDGKVVRNVRDSELTPEEITKINQAGQVIQPLGFTEKLESGFGDISLFSKENKPIADRWQATDTLHGSLQRYTDELAKMDEAALSGVGATATFVTGLVKNTQGFLKLASKDTKSFYDDAVAKNSYVTVEGTDFTKRLEDISNQYKINESEVRDLAYLFAAARGQEGRGLSDKDYENALNIVSGGIGKEGKIGVIQSVYNRLGGEVNRVVNNRIARLENQRSLYGPEDQKYFDIEIGQLRSLQNATPFETFSNPLIQQQTSTTGTTDNIPRVRIKL